MSRSWKLLFCVIFIGIGLKSCYSDTICQDDTCVYATAVVDSTRFSHVGSGLFKVLVYFTYEVDSAAYTGLGVHRYERRHTSYFKEGDSLSVRYNALNPRKVEMIRIIHKNKYYNL